MASYEYTLAIENWRQVLAHVSPGDLCNVVLTSSHMNSVASLPELWAGIKLNIVKVKENGLAELYNINRFKKVNKINFNKRSYKNGILIRMECEEWERLLKDIPGSPLEEADLSWNNLKGVSAKVLASAVSHLRSVNVSETYLTTDQCVELLKAICSSTTLSNVNLRFLNLSEVPSDLLANSISRLKDVKLGQTDLTTDQCIALLKASCSSATLAKVDLWCITNLNKVPSDLLASSISRLEDVILTGTELKTDQYVALLNASLSSTTLANVELLGEDLSKVPAELLADSISRLCYVKLWGTDLTTKQCVALLKAIPSSTTLTKVNLERVKLGKVPADLLASSISHLQDVTLKFTDLTTDQCVALLEASKSSMTLTKLDLSNVNLSEVPASLLASSITRLKGVNLSETRLTADQCVELLKANLSSTTLTKVNLRYVNLRQVPFELLASSITRLQQVNLHRTVLNTDQCIALLEAIYSSTTLTDVDLRWVNLSEVPAALLARSIIRLKDVTLGTNRLTTDQCIALLENIPSSTTLRRKYSTNLSISIFSPLYETMWMQLDSHRVGSQ